MKKWATLIVLAVAQFVMVLDSTVMNVSISTIVKDLDTTVAGLQAAITFYTLTMAAFMLTGGKLGDIWGRLRIFKIGAVIYGLGSLITAISPNLVTLLFGWSLVEGLGAVLVIPAIAALIAISYKGKDRVMGYTMIGAASGIAVAIGPLIGGFMTTYLSWRYVFAAETAIMIMVLLYVGTMKSDAIKGPRTRIDVPSALLSAAGLGLFVLGILQSKSWGWVTPKATPEINGHAIAPFGISLVVYLLLTGVLLVYAFYRRQVKLTQEKRNALLDVSMFKIKALRAGLAVLSVQYLFTAAVFFVIPIYLQMVLGLDALQTGVRIVPLSFGIVLFSLLGSKLSSRRSSRAIIRRGQYILLVGAVLALAAVKPELNGFVFGLTMFVIGAGLGLLVSQIGNVNMSAVPEEKSSEVGGLQGTFQNLGSSLGTALIGSVMIASLTTTFTQKIAANPNISQGVSSTIAQNNQAGIPIASSAQVEAAATSAGLDTVTTSELVDEYESAQMQSLKNSLVFLIILCVLTLPLSRGIPNKKAV